MRNATADAWIDILMKQHQRSRVRHLWWNRWARINGVAASPLSGERDVLEAKGYRVTYSEYIGGRNEVCWRGSFADAIIARTAERRR